ncbi:hypothetical protein BIY28_23050 [Brenneria goodwinii]|nr:hypothetical protein BIY28_23050 [Brenneria goodwinii]
MLCKITDCLIEMVKCFTGKSDWFFFFVENSLAVVEIFFGNMSVMIVYFILIVVFFNSFLYFIFRCFIEKNIRYIFLCTVL